MCRSGHHVRQPIRNHAHSPPTCSEEAATPTLTHPTLPALAEFARRRLNIELSFNFIALMITLQRTFMYFKSVARHLKAIRDFWAYEEIRYVRSFPDKVLN